MRIIKTIIITYFLVLVGTILSSAVLTYLTKEPKKDCSGNVWNVEIYYNQELGLWMGEFDTFVGEKPVHAIAGSSKDKATIEKAINSYCR